MSEELFQSTRPSRDGTRFRHVVLYGLEISIHPPLAGRDTFNIPYQAESRISIHPPLAGRDQQGNTKRR